MSAGEPEEKFLRAEVAGVARLRLVDVARERHRERPPQRRPDPRPRLERRTRPLPRSISPYRARLMPIASPSCCWVKRLRRRVAFASRPSVAAIAAESESPWTAASVRLSLAMLVAASHSALV